MDFNARLSDARTQFIEIIEWLVALGTRLKAGEPIPEIPDLPFGDIEMIMNEVVDFGYDHQGTEKVDFLINAINRVYASDLPAYIDQLKVERHNLGNYPKIRCFSRTRLSAKFVY